MGLLNYSTTIEVEKSVSEITKMLVEHGAKKILLDYDDDKNISSISFEVITPRGPLQIRLAAKKEPILKILNRQKADKKIRIKVDADQALRVAWRVIKDWVEAQMAMVAIEQAEMAEVFLSRILDHKGQTFFDRCVSERLLGAGEGHD